MLFWFRCYNCCAILPSRVRFVHHFSSNEAKVDSLFDVLKLFTTRDVKCDEGIVNQFTIPRSFFTLEKCCYEESSDSDSGKYYYQYIIIFIQVNIEFKTIFLHF